MTAAAAATRRPAIIIVLNLAVALAGLLGGVQPAQAVSTGVVISQIYGGGGNSGATYTNDFIELFNRGATPIDVSGWSVQYASATGTTWQQTSVSGSIAPGRYYLVQEAQGAGGTVSLPTPDATGTIAMAATAGKVALVNTTTPLSGSCPASASVIDLVGYGSTANCFEGTGPAPAPSNTTAILRAASGCTETDGNSADFATATPAPRNSASAPQLCAGGPDAAPAVSSTSPAGGATNVAVNADVTVTFGEPVDVAGTWYTITCATSGAHTASAGGGPTAFTLNPDTDFANSESCTVTVIAGQVTDQDANDPPDTMAADYSWSFTTVTAAVTRVYDIQGASHLSPLNGTAVFNVPGVVTAKRSNGFYLEDPSPDGDDKTSEAIFAFTSSAPNVIIGHAVTVNGTVSEFRPGGSGSTNLTTTELTSPTVTDLGAGPAIAPVVIGAGGRIPPATVIEDDAGGNVETGGTFDPAGDGIDFYESLEGMLVQANNPVVVGPTTSFGEVPVLGDGGASAGVRTPRGGIVIRAGDFNPERVILDDEILKLSSLAMPVVKVGDHFAGQVVGVMDYSFGNYKLQATQAPVAVVDGPAREAATPVGNANQLTLATFNVENLDPTDPQAKFDGLARVIVDNLRSPDLLAVEEIQDNNGATDNGVVAADQTYGRLIAANQARPGGPTYQYRQIDPVNDQDGGEPGGNIRVGFLFRIDRGLGFVDRPGGTSTAATSLVNAGGRPQLSYSPGRVNPTNTAFTSSRKPLAGEFTFNGRTLFVVGNHFNSKGGDDPLLSRASLRPPA